MPPDATSQYRDGLAHASGSSINLSAQSEGFTITGGAGVDAITGGSGVDIITGGGGNDTLAGGAGNDTFNVDSGVDPISDLTTGDILVVSSGATANATFAANFLQQTHLRMLVQPI